MTNATIRIVVLLAVVTLTGIISTQIYLVSQAVSSQEQQFNHTVQLALKNVVESVCEVTGVDVPLSDPIDQVSSNYFIVRTNNRIDLGALEYHLQAELRKHQIEQDFEYGVYDCQSERMIYGDFVSLSSGGNEPEKHALPALEDYDYYFGVYFPQKTQALLWGIHWWKYTSVLTLLILIFFGFTLFVMLRQKRLSAIQRDFINNVTHEFKTPLATLKVATEVISNVENFKDKQRISKYGEIIGYEVGRLEEQVNLLLKSAMVEEKGTIQSKPVDISKMVTDLIGRMDFLSDNKTIQWKSPDPVMVKADPYLLETIIYNLLDNARKYGGTNIRISLEAWKNEVQLTVHDSGAGIPESDKKKVFDKFYRVSHGDRHDVKGFGLGLYVVKKGIRSMGGSIDLRCEEGCEFIIKLPKV